MRFGTGIILCAMCIVIAPRLASAQWSATPHIGAAVGGVPDGAKIDYGAAVGWMGRVVGFEVDVSHSPDFFAVTDVPDVLFSQSSVTTLMVNGVLGVPFGGDRLRPYAAGGVGLFRSHIGSEDDFVRGRANNVGINLGGGVISHLSDRIGLRGDIRYFRDLQEVEGQSEFFSPGSDRLDFWRATAGVVFRF